MIEYISNAKETVRRNGGIGRRPGLKILGGKTRTGSSPVSGTIYIAEWSSLVARRAHNPKVVSSNLASAPNLESASFEVLFIFSN